MTEPVSSRILPSLRRSIVALNVALVLLATLAMGLVALHLVNRQAENHALQVAELSGTLAAEAVARVPDDLLSTATILRDRPTLARYTRERNWRDLEPFLEQFAAGGGLDSAALVIGGEVVGAAGLPVNPAILESHRKIAAPRTVWALPDGQGNGQGNGEMAAVAMAPLPEGLSRLPAHVVVSRNLSQAFLDRLGERADAAVSLLPRARLAAAEPGSPEREVLYAERPVIRAVPGQRRYVAATPLADETGRMIAAVMTYLPAERFEKARNRLLARGATAGVVLALIAVVIGFALGRRLGRPIHALTQATRRMAEQDFATPVPVPRDRELGVLSETMEEMRRRLLDLTAALRQREAQAQLLLANIVEGVFAVDEQRRIQYLNPQAARILGVEADHAIGRFCGDVLRPMGAGNRLPCFHDCPIVHARSGDSTRAQEMLDLEDGPASVVIHSAPPAGGRQVQIIRDETQAEAGRRLRDAVIANVSHEFKTPLAAQTAAIELLANGLGRLGEDEARELIESMSRSTVRLNQLIDNLLESVRIDAREDRLELQPIFIDDLLEEAVGVVNPLILQKRQSLDVEVEAGLPEFSGDAQRLVQVLVNLLSNAIKYAPEASRIRLAADRVGKSLRLVLEDEGPGLDPAHRRAIFDRYYRAPGLSAGQAGMGLGLWIVRSIVERHGGRVEASSEADRGTTFRIFLPLKPAD